MSRSLVDRAIKAALTSNWQEAIKANLEILGQDPKDTEALNRLARAHKEAGEFREARQTYRKVLALDRFNSIAAKNLKLLETLPKSFKKSANSNSYQPPIFLEEPGKTRVVALVNLAPASALLSLSSGSSVNLLVRRRAVAVVDGAGVYLGALPDDLSARLMRLINGGNGYQAFVKAVDKKNLSVFIREIKRSPRFKNQPTFVASYYHFVGPKSLSAEEAEEDLLTSPEEEAEEG